MAIYSASEDNASPASSGQQGTLDSSASGIALLMTVRRGRSTSSTTLTGGRDLIQRSTGGLVPTAGTLTQHNTRSVAPATAYNTTWTTQPTLSGNPLLFVSGGIRQEQTPAWRAPRPWATVVLIDGEQCDEVTTFTSSSASLSLHWQEDQSLAPARSGRRSRRSGLWGHFACDNQYCHKTGTGAYDVHRRATHNYVARARRPAAAPVIAWGNFYGGATPPPDHLPFPQLIIEADYPYQMEV